MAAGRCWPVVAETTQARGEDDGGVGGFVRGREVEGKEGEREIIRAREDLTLGLVVDGWLNPSQLGFGLRQKHDSPRKCPLFLHFTQASPSSCGKNAQKPSKFIKFNCSSPIARKGSTSGCHCFATKSPISAKLGPTRSSQSVDP